VKSTGPDDLRAIGDPLAAELLPGWRIRWSWCAPEDIGGALAMIYPDAKRQMADIAVAPHPEGEDIAESIAHELAHGVVSPLVELIEPSAAEVAIEEPIAERLGVLIARLWKAAGGLARASLRRGVATYEPAGGVRFRARISASAGPRARGGQMDPEKIKALIAAIKEQNGEAALKIAEDLLVSEAAGGVEPDGDEGAMMKDPNKPAPPGADGGGAPPPGGDMRRRDDETEKERARARKAAVEIETIAADARKGAKDRLIDSLRARLPATHKGLPALEKRILAAPDYATAKMIADVAFESAPEAPPDNGRSRGTDGRQTAAPDLADNEPEPEDLKTFDPSFQSEYRRLRKSDALAAKTWIDAGRKRMSRDQARGSN